MRRSTRLTLMAIAIAIMGFAIGEALYGATLAIATLLTAEIVGAIEGGQVKKK